MSCSVPGLMLSAMFRYRLYGLLLVQFEARLDCKVIRALGGMNDVCDIGITASEEWRGAFVAELVWTPCYLYSKPSLN